MVVRLNGFNFCHRLLRYYNFILRMFLFFQLLFGGGRTAALLDALSKFSRYFFFSIRAYKELSNESLKYGERE